MGLDIVAYKNLKWLDPQPEDWQENTVHIYHNSEWEKEHRGDNLQAGYYAADREYSFRAGSYSGYNRWREWLSELALGVAPETVWHSHEAYKDKPFAELINFSDCEGTLGPKVCAKLAKDFKDFEAQAKADEDAYYVYKEFMTVFELTANNGAVVFC